MWTKTLWQFALLGFSIVLLPFFVVGFVGGLVWCAAYRGGTWAHAMLLAIRSNS